MYAHEKLRERKAESVDVLLKHVLRQFFAKLSIDINLDELVNIEARATLSRSNLAAIRSYLASTREAEEVALRERVRAALENFLIKEVCFFINFTS